MCYQTFSWTALLFYCVLQILVYSGSCSDHQLSCGKLAVNQTNLVTGTVDTSVVDASKCLGTFVSNVTFMIIDSQGAEDIICTLTYPGCTPGFHQQGDQECQCESFSGDINTYQLKFFFKESYVGKKLRIKTNCVQAVGREFTYTDCENLKSTVEEDSLTRDEKIGIGVGVGVGVGIIILIVVVVCVCEKKGYCGCCCQCFHSLCSRCRSSSLGAKPKPDVPV